MAKRYEEIDNEKSYIKLIDIGEEVFPLKMIDIDTSYRWILTI